MESEIQWNKESYDNLKKDIDNYIQLNTTQLCNKLTLKKIYTEIPKILFDYTTFPLDIIGVILDYIHDLILLNYNIYVYNKNSEKSISVIILSDNVIIDEKVYVFNYDFKIVYDGKYAMCKLEHILSIDSYEIDRNDIDGDILTFFNEYMRIEHNKRDYIKLLNKYNYNHQTCCYNDDTKKYYIYDHTYYSDTAHIKVINDEKLINIIMIFKLLIEHISNIIAEYINSKKNVYLKKKLHLN